MEENCLAKQAYVDQATNPHWQLLTRRLLRNVIAPIKLLSIFSLEKPIISVGEPEPRFFRVSQCRKKNFKKGAGPF